ncbi:Hydroxyproline O-galactosyltransferase HPGT1-like protein [Drosera capensis]
MKMKASGRRLPATPAIRSRIAALLLSMFAAAASLYVAGRLWQDAESRVYLMEELDKITGQGQSAISLDDSLRITACREQRKKLSALEMELAAAKQEGFVSKYSTGVDQSGSKKKPVAVIGILTSFGRRNKRDAIRKAWMGTGASLKKLENDKNIVVRPNRGDSLDSSIDNEDRETKDFIILDNHVETEEALPKKTMLFFAHVADNWDAQFYAKANDDVFVNVDALGSALAAHADKPRVYVGCMKSGEVFSELSQKWYEPDWWKFGDGKTYFRHASSEIFVISQALARFVSINR